MANNIRETIRSIAGEFLVTFIFLSVVFSMIINTSRATDPVVAGTVIPGIVVAFVATAIIYSFADVSGAHFNPAVTIGFIVTGKIHPLKGIAYILSQLLASIAAAAFMFLIFPNKVGEWPKIAQVLPVVPPKTSPLAAVLMMEFYLTFLIVYIIFATAVDSPADAPLKRILQPGEEDTDGANVSPNRPRGSNSIDDLEARKGYSGGKACSNVQVYVTPGPNKNNFAPLAIGLTLGFLCYLGGSSSGGAFNPARVFGASVISGNFKSHWVYWAGDMLGGAFAALIHTFIYARRGAILSAN